MQTHPPWVSEVIATEGCPPALVLWIGSTNKQLNHVWCLACRAYLIMWKGCIRFWRRMHRTSQIRMRATLRTLRASPYTETSCRQLCLQTCKRHSVALQIWYI